MSEHIVCVVCGGVCTRVCAHVWGGAHRVVCVRVCVCVVCMWCTLCVSVCGGCVCVFARRLCVGGVHSCGVCAYV